MNYSLAPVGLSRVALLLIAFGSVAIPSSSRADQGGIELVNGGRINGDVMVVMPGDHVAIRLADGTAVSVAWTDVVRVFDGPRVYDGRGQVSAAPAQAAAPAPIEPPVPAPAPLITMMPGDDVPPIYQTAPPEDDRAFRLAYANLPRRGGTVMLFSLSGAFTLNALAMIATGASFGCYEGYSYSGSSYYSDYDSSCGFRTGMIAGGTVSLALGAVTFWRAVRRKRTRARGVRQLREGMVARTRDALDLSVDARIDGQTFVPRLTLSF